MPDSDSSTAAGTMGELLWVVPRLLDRTSRQLELSKAFLGLIPCIGTRLNRSDAQTSASARDCPDIDVLDVLNEDDASDSQLAPSDGLSRGAGVSTPALPARSDDSDTEPADGSSVPDESQLAVPQYDSLAASQVIPRLEMLRPEDLQNILRYEERNRNRQTIVHKVRQLLSAVG